MLDLLTARLAPALEVPVLPEADEARRWARDELARAEYSTEPSLIERVWHWLVDQLGRLTDFDAVAPPTLVPIVVVVGVALLLGVAIYLGGPVRARRRTAARGSFAVFDDEAAGSEELSAAADAAARDHDWPLAVLMRFRAIIRDLDERGVLDDLPGMTAYEASGAAAALLPGHTRELRWAGDLFDAVCYGSAQPGPREDAQLRELAAAVARARPGRVPVPARTGWAELS